MLPIKPQKIDEVIKIDTEDKGKTKKLEKSKNKNRARETPSRPSTDILMRSTIEFLLKTKSVVKPAESFLEERRE